jgi:ABC-type transport system substrate-binding protein/DNA-binding SARP family transcriptional activator/DNA-binding beta-propeller fold protein YncE
VGNLLEFRILGPLEVRVDGVHVHIGGPRQRALLALLLCNANHVVARDRLVEDLLGGLPPESARRMLQVQISRLRKTLDPRGDQLRLVARSPGYLLRVEEDELDLHVFERRVADGRRSLERADPVQASAMLSEAESLWRGTPVADLEFEPFVRFELQRLQELRLVALEDRVEADLALGRHAALCPELEALIAEHPLRERLRGQLMLALYRAGRQADALATYRAGRELLVGELAIEPSRALRQLERAILQQDDALEPSRTRRPLGPATLLLDESEAIPTGARTPDRAPPARHRGRGRNALVAVGIVTVLAGLWVAARLGPSARRINPPRGNVLALVARSDGTILARVPLQATPTDLAAGLGSVWVAEASKGLVVRVDMSRRRISATIPVGRRPTRIATAAGQVWVLDPVDRTVSRIDPATNAVVQTIAVQGDGNDLAVSEKALWVADPSERALLWIDPRTGRVRRVDRLGTDTRGLAVSRNAVWVANGDAGTVTRVDARTGAIAGSVHVGQSAAALAVTPTGVWVLDPLDGTLSRIDPGRGTVAATVRVVGKPTGLMQLRGSDWVTDERGMLLRIDPRRAAVTQTIRIGEEFRAVAAAGGMWIAAGMQAPGHRGGTLTSIASTYLIDSIDPAAGTSTDLPPPQFFGLTNDGLVTLNHVGGSRGAKLVPDLAQALPAPRDRGRIYTFQLRPGIRYSSGALVKPSDFTHSFERLFELGSSGAARFQAITGAGACERAPRGCDLSRGIIADDHQGTLTFRLTRADPDFLYKLTLAYAVALPSSVPNREARSPLPATGPYEIVRYDPGQEAVLARNPRFRQWSAAAQPDGYPDRIVLRLGLNASQGTNAVAIGRADLLASIGGIEGQGRSFLEHHRRQVQINRAATTDFLFLNVRARPFNDVRVRRALNLALDRRRLVNYFGGPAAATPTCQLLPPQIPGYRRYCPYTGRPAAHGRWRSPNLARANRLVAASGTRGMPVSVWDTHVPAPLRDEGRVTVAALRELGYRASLHLLPDSTFFSYTNDSRSRAQIIDGGWSADYPTADDFISRLKCASFVPDDSPATSDPSGFCDTAFDRQADHAASLQRTNTAAAAALWGRLDRQLTDRAILLPTVTPNETDFISRRVHNYQYNPVWGVLLDQLWVR